MYDKIYAMIANGVYIIKNDITNKIYIGSTSCKGGFKDRFRHHRSALKNNRHCNKHLQKAYNKYGLTAFSYEILEKCLPEKCLEREQHYLDLYKSHDPLKGYNLCQKAGSSFGRKHSEETRKKIGQNRVYGPSPFKGKKHSEQSIKNMSDGQKNSKKSKENLAKLNKSKRIPVVGINLVTGEIVELEYAGADSRFIDSGITMCCRGRIQHYKGFRWSYKQ
jgi:group I intron endonuclease